MEKNIVGPRIRQARLSEKPKISQGDLSARMKMIGVPIDQKTISKIELQQRPVIDIELRAFAKVLKVTPRWLMGENDEP